MAYIKRREIDPWNNMVGAVNGVGREYKQEKLDIIKENITELKEKNDPLEARKDCL